MLELLRVLGPVLTPAVTFGLALLRLRLRKSSNKIAQAVANGTSQPIQTLAEQLSKVENELAETKTQLEISLIKLQSERGINSELKAQNRKYERLLKREQPKTTKRRVQAERVERLPPSHGDMGNENEPQESL